MRTWEERITFKPKREASPEIDTLGISTLASKTTLQEKELYCLSHPAYGILRTEFYSKLIQLLQKKDRKMEQPDWGWERGGNNSQNNWIEEEWLCPGRTNKTLCCPWGKTALHYLPPDSTAQTMPASSLMME